MKKLFVFLTFVLGIVGLMAWIVGSSNGLKALDVSPDYELDDL